MSAQNEELRDQIAKEIHRGNSGSNTLWETSHSYRHKEGEVYDTADEILAIIYDLFGGQSNFEAVLKLVEQVKVPCKECDGTGQEPFNHPAFDKPLTRDCIWCHGSGQVMQIERLVVLAEDQSLPELRNQAELHGCNTGCHVVEQNNMLQAGFRKIAGGEVIGGKKR